MPPDFDLFVQSAGLPLPLITPVTIHSSLCHPVLLKFVGFSFCPGVFPRESGTCLHSRCFLVEQLPACCILLSVADSVPVIPLPVYPPIHTWACHFRLKATSLHQTGFLKCLQSTNEQFKLWHYTPNKPLTHWTSGFRWENLMRWLNEAAFTALETHCQQASSAELKICSLGFCCQSFGGKDSCSFFFYCCASYLKIQFLHFANFLAG